ncbi:CpaD family pilus assembly protein [Asticcacaulis sp.]|uniref:CpaD family pilus assembly protein n=1 Tax=Asticcacaulis sp. TaxID=1872648 RepID=UPI002CB0687E|nr:CpaD family pilus assembly lipoprotein [Asticcacaulis sp.]HTM80577.1 CpaD family pilus assembly lipoprotein [Asticcacaulis sp.]
MTHLRPLTLVLALTALAALTGCATGSGKAGNAALTAATPTEQYPLQAQTMTKTINLRINAGGLSDNQRTALDQIAEKASWTSGAPVDVEIITSPDPRAIAAGQTVGGYLVAHDVDGSNLSQLSQPGQPADIVTVNIVNFRARTYACGQTWENLAATRNNTAYQNFGCAVSSNLAAQIADPRDLQTPRAATPVDMGRRSAVLDKYRKGEVTSSAKDDNATGAISNAIK